MYKYIQIFSRMVYIKNEKIPLSEAFFISYKFWTIILFKDFMLKKEIGEHTV